MTEAEIFRSLLNETANVEEQTQIRDAQNQIVTTWSVKIPDMLCRIQKLRPNEVFSSVGAPQGGSAGSGQYTKSFFRINAEIENDIINTDRLNVNGTIYEIIGAFTDSSNHHWELECKKIES